MILGYKKGMGSFMKKLFCLFISVLGLFLLANCSKKEYDLKYLCEHRTEEVEIAYKQLIKWEGFECEKILFYKRSEMLESDYNKLRDYFSFNFEEILVSKTTINSLIPLAIEFTNEIEKESIYEVLKSNEYEISYFVRGKIYFVDVGQGDCTLICTPSNKTILIIYYFRLCLIINPKCICIISIQMKF